MVITDNSRKEDEMRHKVKKMFRNADNLPSLPIVVQKIFASINDPSVGAKELARIVTNDQALASKVLKLVNSSFFGLRGKIQNIHHAVTMLGFSTLRQLCLGVSLTKYFNNLKSTAGLTGEEFWLHSISTAILSNRLAKVSSVEADQDVCYTVGLIHDIGKLLLLQYHRDRYVEALKKARDENIPLVQAEVDIFEVDHCAVGSWLYRNWKLPRETRRAVKSHHNINPDEISPVSEDALTGVVYFANLISHHFEIGNSGNPVSEFDEEKFRTFFGESLEEMEIDRVKIEEETMISLEILGLTDSAGKETVGA
ncbi:MAG: HDOD domain-containing protein [Candidatus Latescibacteria bacterium]|nr:HDOD domain-containing protein [bacterium]MBD3423812.1 HDOD domain-containing protein [Candidatus Latescibacterota bacterium]